MGGGGKCVVSGPPPPAPLTTFYFFRATTIGATPQCVSIKYIFHFPLKKKCRHSKKLLITTLRQYKTMHSVSVQFSRHSSPPTRSLGSKLCEPSCRGEAVYHIYKRGVKIITSCRTNRKILRLPWIITSKNSNCHLSLATVTLILTSATEGKSSLILTKTKIFENESLVCHSVFFYEGFKTAEMERLGPLNQHYGSLHQASLIRQHRLVLTRGSYVLLGVYPTPLSLCTPEGPRGVTENVSPFTIKCAEILHNWERCLPDATEDSDER